MVAAEAVLATLNEPVRQALLPAVVEADELTAAAGQLGVGANLARLVGGALGGVLLEAYGLGGVVLGDAATFLLAAALLAGRRLGAGAGRRRRGPPERAGRAWLAGLAVVRDRPALRGTLAVTALMALAQGAFVVLFVVFVLRRLGGGGRRGRPAARRAGGRRHPGGLAVGRLARRFRPAALVGAGWLGFALVEAAIWNGPALTTALPLYVALFVAWSACPASSILSGLTAVHAHRARRTAFRGRVASTHAGVFGVLQAAGMLLAGLLVEPVGLLPLLNAQAAVLAVAGAGGRGDAAVSAAGGAASSAAPPGRARRRRPVGPAVVGDERVVALQPPAAVDRPDGPLDHQLVGAGGEAADHHVAGAHPVGRAGPGVRPRAAG